MQEPRHPAGPDPILYLSWNQMLSSRDARQRQEVTKQREFLPLTANTVLSHPQPPGAKFLLLQRECLPERSCTLVGVRVSHLSWSGHDKREAFQLSAGAI